jgi:hypothetical protein
MKNRCNNLVNATPRVKSLGDKIVVFFNEFLTKDNAQN